MSSPAFAVAEPLSRGMSASDALSEIPDLRDLLTRLSGEVAARLTRALEHLGDLADSGRPDGKILQSVGDEIASARRAGIVGQQIVRLASGHVRPETESVLVCDMLRTMIAQRSLADPNTFEFRADRSRARIDCDASLMGALLQSMLDWCAEQGSTSTKLTLADTGSQIGLTLSAAFSLADDVASDALDSLNWHLMYFTAKALGAALKRHETGQLVSLIISLPWPAPTAAPTTVEVPALPTAGCQVLVVAPERRMRDQVRLAIRGLDLLVDCVSSLDAAERYCADRLPEAVVYDGGLDGQRVSALRCNLRAEEPGLPFIEIAQHGFGEAARQPGVSRVQLDGLTGQLAAALATELARAR